MEITVESWVDLQKVLFEDKDTQLDRFRSPFVFRGLSDKSYELRSSLDRLDNETALIEKYLLRNFKKYAPRELLPDDNEWNLISIAQHHGLPTRLLDWTFSPYVALHFMSADIDKFDCDGAIWCVDFHATRRIANKVFQDKLNEGGYKAFTVGLLAEICPRISDFNLKNYGENLIFFEPPSMDSRIVNQFALFSVMTNPKTIVSDWLSEHKNLFKKIIIPASLKWEIRDKLDQANITERVIYPGLDGLAAWLKRWYSKKN